MKVCSLCHDEKPCAEFYTKQGARDGLMSWCKSCHRRLNDVNDAKRRARDPEGERAKQRRYERHSRIRKHGIEPEEFDALVVAQDGRCAICGVVVELYIDHDHTSGEVRGLLCNHCNLGLGHFRDDPVRLHAALRYLAASVL